MPTVQTESQFMVAALTTEQTDQTLRALLPGQFEWTCYQSPERFMVHLSRRGAHLLLIELDGPGFDGFEWLERIRSLVPAANLILLSNRKSLEIISRSNQEGADYLFFLPPDALALQKALQSMQGRRNYWLQLAREVRRGTA